MGPSPCAGEPLTPRGCWPREQPRTCAGRAGRPASAGRVVCFQFLTVLNAAAMSLFVHDSPPQRRVVFRDRFLEGGSRGHRERSSS